MADMQAGAKEGPVLDVSIPLEAQGVPIKGLLRQAGRPPKVMYFSPASLARVLGDIKAEEADLGTWWDLLGATGYAAKRSGTQTQIVMTTPAGIRDIRYGAYRGETAGDPAGYTTYKIHLPPLVWVLTFASEKLTGGKLFCAERLINSLEEDAKLVVYPYGHANEGGGQICWGNTAINHVTVKDPRLAERMFFSSGTNHHLYAARWLGPSLQDFLVANQTEAALKVPVPLPWREAGRSKTIRQILGDTE